MRNALLLVGIVLIASIAAPQSSVLELAVKSYPDPTNSYPDSHLYVAIARNVSKHQILSASCEIGWRVRG